MKNKKVMKRTGGDIAHAVVKIALGAIPRVGGVAAGLFNFIVTPPLEKRKAEWVEEVERRLTTLEAEGFDIQALQNDPEFLDVILQATQVVLRTSVAEKKSALLNA